MTKDTQNYPGTHLYLSSQHQLLPHELPEENQQRLYPLYSWHLAYAVFVNCNDEGSKKTIRWIVLGGNYFTATIIKINCRQVHYYHEIPQHINLGISAVNQDPQNDWT